MVKCKILESFGSENFTGIAGTIQEMPRPEAEDFQRCGFLEILPEEEQEEEPIAFETAKQARNLETAKQKRVIKKK